ncbi:MAG: IS1 family transposase [Planctomycetota bacterium]|nr:MAG: IS1 family transposase [Planctomycetota bacterium]
MMVACAHAQTKRFGFDRKRNPRVRCLMCGKTWTIRETNPLGTMRIPVETAKLALRLLVEGMSIRATERTTGLHRDTICKLLVHFGDACQRFLDERMRGLTLSHLQFDEQWTYVYKKQSRLTTTERAETSEQGDIYLWTCVDQKTKLMPAFLVGKRSADNARRFMMDVAGRLTFPKPHVSDDQSYLRPGYKPVTQISTDGFNAYPEAVDLAFGPYVKYGVIIKEYRNARMIYTPSEMVGTKRTGMRGIEGRNQRTICTSHVERLNGTQRLFLKRLNRLTYCFSKKLRNLEAAFAGFAAYYNFCWQTRKPGKSGAKRGTAAMMAGLAGHVWSFDELFETVLNPATHK